MKVKQGENEGGKWEMIFTYFIKKKRNPKSSFPIFKKKENFHKLAAASYKVI